ncbi:hypothetical protein WI665_19405 [Vibrio cholerae]
MKNQHIAVEEHLAELPPQWMPHKDRRRQAIRQLTNTLHSLFDPHRACFHIYSA